MGCHTWDPGVSLASGASYRIVSRVFEMPRSTGHRIVTKEVVGIRHKVIHFPKTPEDQEAMSHGFTRQARHRAFLKAAGAIDMFTSNHQAALMVSATGTGNCSHPLSCRLFVTIRATFFDTYVDWPVSVHDSRVLHHSPLYRTSIYPPPGHFILADGG